MGIKKLTELESVTPESGEDASVYGEVGGKVVKLPYGQTDETAIKEAVTAYLEENDIAAGNGIASVTQIESSKASSGANIWRVTMTDGTYYDLTIYNGEQGTAEAEVNAKASAEAAANSANAAATSEGNAATSETNAKASAEAAANSANAASASEGNAATSETNAKASAEAAAESAKIVSEAQSAIAEETEYALIASLDGTPEAYKSTMRLWFRAHGSDDATPAELTALCDKWYSVTRPSWDGNVSFYQPDVSAVSTGTKGGDNANLTCTPSTDTVANQDDYAGLPLFACVDCNWVLDPDTLQPLITAIDGINDSFVRTDPDVYVGVLQMSGYHYWYDDDTTYTHGYTATAGTPYANIEPVPEAANPDGTFRQWVVHSKYMSHTTDAGKMSSYSGVIPTAFVSHNTVHTLSAVNGDGYSGGTTADYSWIILMMYIKYGSLTLDGILQGCCNISYQYAAQVAEEGVNRIILTTANAANLEVGMSVLLGNYTTSTDRGTADMYSISGNGGCRITAIETVTINGAEYSAVYVDLEDTFDTTVNGSAAEGTTCLSSWHWATGSCDGVLGNDGSPANCTNGKYPAKLQGIEYMSGGYEVLADVILNLYLSDETYYYEPYICRLRANQSTSITSNYVATGLIIAQPATVVWEYIKRLQYAMGVFFPEEVGGSSSTYTRDAFYQNAATVGAREWLAFGALSHGVVCGSSCLAGSFALSDAYWFCLARLSPNGNRGELVA